MAENVNVEELMNSKNPMFGGCPSIEKAIAEFYESGQRNFSIITEMLDRELKEDAEVIAPVAIPENFFGGMNPEEIQVGQEFTSKEDQHFTVQFLDGGNGKRWYAVFTSMAEVEKGAMTSTMPILLKDMMVMAYEDPDSLGLVINPWNQNLDITKEGLGILRPLFYVPTEDEINLDKGSEAYMSGDYEAAIKYYQLAADMGNVTALSNLGYCYYYGRSIPVNKEMARTCWEKAAILGDVCATYKLGDMYRNGDLPVDPVFSTELYKEAFTRAIKTRSVDYYPDACLRMLKYCKDITPEDIYAALAKDAVDGFKARVDEGDKFAEKMYREALEILESIK